MRSASTKVSAADREQLIEHPVSVRRIAGLFSSQRLALATVLALIVVAAAVALIPPFLTKAIIDDALPHQNVSLLVQLVGGILAVTVLTQAVGVVQTWMATRIGQNVMHDLRTQLFEHLQAQPLSFFTKTRGGEVQSRLTNDVSGMQSVVTGAATSIATNVTTAVGTAIAMATLSWRLSLISLVVLPPAVLLSRRIARARTRVQTKAQQTLAQMQTDIEESLSIGGVLLSKTTGAGPMLSTRFRDASRDLTIFELESQMAGRWRMGALATIFAAIPTLIYLAAGLPATSGGMTIGTLVAFTGLQAALFRPLMGVLSVGVQITTSKALFSRIFEYIDLPVDIADPAEPVEIDVASARGAVRFDDVSLRYEGSDVDALSHVCLQVPAGSSLAIVGSTGSGKSTLASLVSRLSDPTSGVIRLDDLDVRDMRLSDIAQLVGVVSQDTYLLHASIADNLRYAKPEATDDELVAAAKAAQVYDLITRLPDGFDTLVGARGYRFSGGEKQRIALARTILRNPPVLVLDEATSALDNDTERAVQAAIDEMATDRTTITIAHRLSTIRHADQIVVLEGGRIVERGTHEQLLAAQGRYAQLLAAQQDNALELAS